MIGFLNVILQNLNPSRSTFGRPYNSTSGFSEKGQLILFLIIIITGFYIGLKVWKSLKNKE